MFKKLLLVCVLCCVSGLSYAKQNNVPFSGVIAKQELLEQYPQFSDEYNRYTPTKNDQVLIKKLAGKEVIVLFGTWCHDSQREVPRFLKLIHQANVDVESVSLVAVGYNKQDPAGIAQKYALKYTPTIIVLDKGNEVARMVEKPEESIAISLTQSL